MNNEFNTSFDSLSDGGVNASPDGNGAGSVSVKDVLGEVLGKTFKDDETALKSVKDTFNFVGGANEYKPIADKLKQKFGSLEEAKAKIDEMTADEQTVSKKEFEEFTFYSQNADYAPYRELISGMKKPGQSLQDVVTTPAFKTIFEKAKAHDDVERSRSVLQTNSRIGEVTDKMAKAREAVAAGNQAEANKNAVASVIDAFELS